MPKVKKFRLPKPKTAARAVTGILLLLSFFQLMLVLGAPLGFAAYGGQFVVLPLQFRMLSVTTIIVYFITSYALRSRVGLTKTSAKDPLVRIGAWLAAGVFLFSMGANAISLSYFENFVMAPISLVLFVLTFIVAKSK